MSAAIAAMPVAVPSTPKKAAVAKKTSAKKAKVPSAHPKYSDMITKAIAALKEKNGSSRQAIGKFILANYKVDDKALASRLKIALKRGVDSGSLKRVKGVGASGSFRIAVDAAKKVQDKAKMAEKAKIKKEKLKAKKAASKAKAAAKKAASKGKKPAKKTGIKAKAAAKPKVAKASKPKVAANKPAVAQKKTKIVKKVAMKPKSPKKAKPAKKAAAPKPALKK